MTMTLTSHKHRWGVWTPLGNGDPIYRRRCKCGGMQSRNYKESGETPVILHTGGFRLVKPEGLKKAIKDLRRAHSGKHRTQKHDCWTCHEIFSVLPKP